MFIYTLRFTLNLIFNRYYKFFYLLSLIILINSLISYKIIIYAKSSFKKFINNFYLNYIFFILYYIKRLIIN